MVKISQIHLWLAICLKLYGARLTISSKVKSWLAHKVMACGKGSGKSIIGNQLTKDNNISLSKSWLVQKQTASGKDKSNPFKAGGLLKITWLSFGPKFLLELKQIGYSRSDGFW